MKTIGRVLREYRQKNHLSTTELSRRTSVPTDIIESLENEETRRLPAASLVKGYVKLISAEVGLSEENALALFRRDLGKQTKSVAMPRRRRIWRLTLSPRLLSLTALWIAIFIGGAWAFWQWRQLGQEPFLVISSPQNYAIVGSPVIINGQAHPDASVTVNTEIVSLDQQGRFNLTLELPPGERAVVVQAVDRRGRQSERVLFITVE